MGRRRADRTGFDVLAYFSATCVGLQRVEADAHWPSDVAGSLLLAGIVLVPIAASTRSTDEAWSCSDESPTR